MKTNYPKRFESIKPIDVYHVTRSTDSQPHWHTGYLITFVYEGDGVETKNGIDYEIKKGKISVLSPSDIHSNRLGELGYFSYYACIFRQDVYFGGKGSSISNFTFPMTAYLQGEEFDETFFIFKMLEKYSQKPLQEYKSIIIALIEILLKTADSNRYSVSSEVKVNSISSAVNYLNSHFNEEISQKKLADMCGFSTDYFGRLFKKEMGVNFSNYLLSLRLDCAARLLISGANAQEACFGCGFSSFNWFSTAFSRRFGVPPKKYALLKLS